MKETRTLERLSRTARERRHMAEYGCMPEPPRQYDGGAEIPVSNGPNALSERLDRMAPEKKAKEREQ